MPDLSWRIASAADPISFRSAASKAGFQFMPSQPGADFLRGTLTPSGNIPDDPLPGLLGLPLLSCAELGIERFRQWPHTPLLTLIISTATAFACDPGTAFARALARLDKVAAARQEDLRLCLHEAIANGVLHGNLEIAGGKARSPEQFLEHARLLERRLTDPVLTQRPIEIGADNDGRILTVWVADRGDGFEQRAEGGRGLDLIGDHCDKYWHENGGNRIVMQFLAGDRTP